MKKYIKDGKVAVLVSPGYGAGWSTWGEPELAFHYDLAKAIDEKGSVTEEEGTAIVNDKDIYCGGVGQLKIEWLTPNSRFRITEYDGFESLEYIGEINYLTA